MSLLRGTLAPGSFLLTSILLWLWPLRGQNTIRKNVLNHSLRGAECEQHGPWRVTGTTAQCATGAASLSLIVSERGPGRRVVSSDL